MDEPNGAMERLAELYERWHAQPDAREIIGLYVDTVRAHLRLEAATKRMGEHVVAMHVARQVQCLVRQAGVHMEILEMRRQQQGSGN